MSLKVAYCSREAARFAVERWHYSRVMPAGKAVFVGVWEDEAFIGALVFSRGACPYALAQFGVEFNEGCELTRVALRAHRAPVSRIVRFGIKLLLVRCPGIRVVVSFADPDKGHVGGIYQALGWVYTGTSEATRESAPPRGSRARHPRKAQVCPRGGWLPAQPCGLPGTALPQAVGIVGLGVFRVVGKLAPTYPWERSVNGCWEAIWGWSGGRARGTLARQAKTPQRGAKAP